MSIQMIFNDRKFWPLFWTQFLGALNDNVLKNAMVLLVTYRGLSLGGLDAPSIVALSGGIFILPFFLFSMLAGQLSDKYEKSHMVRLTKGWEVLITLTAALGFYLESLPVLLLSLFMIGMQATFFGPVKYSALPDLVEPEKLIEANAYVELGTFMAILIGTIAGGVLIGIPHGALVVGGVLVSCSLLGLASSFKMQTLTRGAPDLVVQYNPIAPIAETVRLLRQTKTIFNSVLGISWFWFFGAAVLSVLPTYCKDYLHASEHVVTAFLAMFTMGIGLGSVACEKLSFRRVEIGLVPIGSLGMTIFLFDLCMVRPDMTTAAGELLTVMAFLKSSFGPRLLIDFFMMSVFGGFFILPLYTLIQERSEKSSRSRVIAGNNVLNALYMVIASLLITGLHIVHVSLPHVFMMLALLNVLATIYIYLVVPEFALRFCAWMLAHVLYKVRVTGHENIPETGPAVLVCNHVSYVDWLVIMAGVRRPASFIMHYKFFTVPIIKTLMRQARVIPIAGQKENLETFNSAFERVAEELNLGNLVCIFPEGHITRDGKMDEFRKGIEHILARNPVPVIPMSLSGLWGSFFSYKPGSRFGKIKRSLWSRVSLDIGRPVPAWQARAANLEKTVRGMLRPD